MKVAERPVSEVMERDVVSLKENDRLDLVDDIMRLGRIRHLPVLDDANRVVGVVSNRDLLAASLSKNLDFEPTHRRAFIRAVDVGEVMSRKVVSLGADASLREAAEAMLRHQIGSVIVTTADGVIEGLVTESDLLRAAFLSDPAGS